MTDTKPMKIVFLDRETLSPETMLRMFTFPHEMEMFGRTPDDQVADRIASADIVITNKARIGREAIAGATGLRMIAVAATGTDVIDVKACDERGIVVSNIRNYAVNTVPEHTFGLILALRRSILAYAASVRDGRWQEADQFCYFDYPISNLSGSTLGIVGDGVLGRAVADLGRAFGMNVLFASYKGVEGMGPLYTDFDRVLEISNVITLHCPLIPSTRSLISTREFALMRRKPLLINTARGGLVDEAALETALDEGRIAGAGFDVVTTEPPALDNPLMRMSGRPNFILTPHVAWASSEAIQYLADQLVENIELFVKGYPRHQVGKAG